MKAPWTYWSGICSSWPAAPSSIHSHQPRRGEGSSHVFCTPRPFIGIPVTPSGARTAENRAVSGGGRGVVAGADVMPAGTEALPVQCPSNALRTFVVESAEHVSAGQYAEVVVEIVEARDCQYG
ncbi:hypothetical protein HPB52_020491 [Rhipicephalus sanguineus]|uniref:Uncharacterized protein n=1 Tax=Rhipicephalus sanguineus TaxID=34632 RepID=A0A9D4ST52_RHISA|nr:hypothetical protein HPB52_020491 [Rhipicephalus sanguineus]